MENFKDLGDVLGKPRNLGIGTECIQEGTVFGKPSISAHEVNLWGAAETITGEYGCDRDDGVTVNDLGRSITPGFRNITTEVMLFYSRALYFTVQFHCRACRLELSACQVSAVTYLGFLPISDLWPTP